MKIISGSKEKLEQSIADNIKDIINYKSNAKLLLATGNSPIGIYQKLINFYQEKKISFKNVITFNLDEYLEKDKYFADSFLNFMNQKLYKINFFDITILGVGENGHIAFNEPGSKITDRTKIIELTDSTIKTNFKNRTNYPKKAITIGIKDILDKSQLIYIIA